MHVRAWHTRLGAGAVTPGGPTAVMAIGAATRRTRRPRARNRPEHAKRLRERPQRGEDHLFAASVYLLLRLVEPPPGSGVPARQSRNAADCASEIRPTSRVTGCLLIARGRLVVRRPRTCPAMPRVTPASDCG